MSDIGRSFAHLQDSIPQWLHAVARVEGKVIAMQDQVTTVAVSRSPFAKRASASVASIAKERMDVIAEDLSQSHSASLEAAVDGEKRSPSVLSGRISASSPYRPRTMVVVSYDGEMQKSLEQLVRAISIGRNLLRKARMESRMNGLAALAGSDGEDEDDAGDSEEEALVPKSSHRPRMSSMRARAAARTSGRLGVANSTTTPLALFETIDKQLERTQELCEKAAHLTLREGDCRTELVDVRNAFEDVLQTAATEAVRINAHRPQDPPELLSHDTSDTSVSSLETPSTDYYPHIAPSMPPPEPPPKVPQLAGLTPIPQPKIPQLAGLTPAPPEPKILGLEVDDDDAEEEEDEDFVMPPVRLTSRMNARVQAC